eukprot:1150319-Pelagomonas_calceolata.AAC.3
MMPATSTRMTVLAYWAVAVSRVGKGLASQLFLNKQQAKDCSPADLIMPQIEKLATHTDASTAEGVLKEIQKATLFMYALGYCPHPCFLTL